MLQGQLHLCLSDLELVAHVVVLAGELHSRHAAAAAGILGHGVGQLDLAAGTAEFVSKYFQKGSLIAIEGSLQTRQYQDKNGNNRTAVEVVANNVNFAGSKSNGSNQGGGSYQNAAPSYQNAAPARPAAVEAAPSYSAGNADDFAVIDDSDDLPF